jgi:hypothetical protein
MPMPSGTSASRDSILPNHAPCPAQPRSEDQHTTHTHCCRNTPKKVALHASLRLALRWRQSRRIEEQEKINNERQPCKTASKNKDADGRNTAHPKQLARPSKNPKPLVKERRGTAKTPKQDAI